LPELGKVFAVQLAIGFAAKSEESCSPSDGKVSIDDWIGILAEFAEKCAVAWLAFMEFLPVFVVTHNNEVIGRFLAVVAK
jgi:hypothetical protein